MPPIATATQRPLSTSEALWARLCEKTTNNFVGVCTLTGPVNPTAMCDAIKQAAQVYPMLGAIVMGTGASAYIEFGGTPATAHKVQVIDRVSPDHWRSIAEAEVNRHITLGGESLWTATLIVGPDASELVFGFNHLIADATSWVTFTKQILAIYAGAPAPATMLPPASTDHTYRPWRTPLHRAAHFGAATLAFLSGYKRVFYRLGVAGALPAGGEGATRFESVRLAADTSERIAAAAKAHGITVHGVLCAAAALAVHAVADTNGPLDMCVSSAVNLRPQLASDHGQAFGCFASSVEVAATVGDQTDFWSLATGFSQGVRKQVVRGRPRFDDHLRRLLLRKHQDYESLVAALRGALKTTFLVTNMGRVAMPTAYGALQLTQCLFIPSCHFLRRPQLVIAALTLDRAMCLTFAYPVPYTDAAVLRRVIAGTIQRLQTLA